MTRILYLPTGAYLSFRVNDNRDEFTEHFEQICNIYYDGLFKRKGSIKSKIVVFIRAIVANDQENNSLFIQRNKISIPCIEEHLEIVDD